jgi:putative peptidoglycan lipid II flippase
MRSTLVVSSSRLLNTGLSLVLGMLSATYFGTSVEKDCYLVAQTIPNLVSALLLGGLYANLLVSLAEVGRGEGISGQKRFARRTLWHITLMLVPCVLVAVAGARFLIASIAPGLGPGQIDLSAALLRISVFWLASGVYFTVIRCLFEARSRFVAPYFTHLLVNLVSLLILVLLVQKIGIFALAAGPVLGGGIAVGLLCLLTGTLRDPGGFSPATSDQAARDRQQRRFWAAFLPMSIAGNIGPINLLVDNAFASFLRAGSITTLGFAFVIVSNAEMLTSLSLAEVAFPRLAAAAHAGREELAATLRSSQRYMLIVTAPLSAGVLVFGAPVARLLFERGQFLPESTMMVAKLLACYAPEILFMGYLVLLSRVLFATRRLAALAWTSAGAISAHALLDYLLIGPFGLPGIALATTGVALLHVLLLVPLVRREVGDLQGRGDSLFMVKIVMSAAIMGAVVLVWATLFERYADVRSETLRLVEVAVGIGLGGGIYTALMHVLRIAEARELFQRLLRFTVGRSRPLDRPPDGVPR